MSMKHFKDDFSVGTVMAVIGSVVGLKRGQRVTELASHHDCGEAYCFYTNASDGNGGHVTLHYDTDKDLLKDLGYTKEQIATASVKLYHDKCKQLRFIIEYDHDVDAVIQRQKVKGKRCTTTM